MGPGHLCLRTGFPPPGTQDGMVFWGGGAEASSVFPHGIMKRGSVLLWGGGSVCWHGTGERVNVCEKGAARVTSHV